MRRRLGGWIAVLMLCPGTMGGAAAGPIDCGSAPSVKCLAAAIFALAKTLPDDSYFRRHVSFAERELAPGDIKAALDYVVSDNPDPSPWDDIEWITRAGRFDAAIKQAKQRTSAVERLGGLLAVAAQMLDRNDPARATKIVDEVERELPSIKADDNDQDASSLSRDAGEIRARLGQTERAARLIGGKGLGSIDSLLAMASKYPVAASLREQAWREAELFNEPYAWQLLVQDAISRGDHAEASRAGERASAAIAGATDVDHPDPAISLAQVLLTADLPDMAAKLIKPWPQWVVGKETPGQSNTVLVLMPVLAGLARDQDVEAAARAVNNAYYRSQCLGKAADAYFRLGRSDVAEKFDAEALDVAVSSPTGEPKLEADHYAALQNLAIIRGGHRDIHGALAVVANLRDSTQVLEVTSYVAGNAIDGGYGPVAGPAIEALQQLADIEQDAGLLLRAAHDWYAVGNEGNARKSLARVMKGVEERGAPFAANDLGLAAELTWRLGGAGKAESLLAIVDKIGVNDPSAIDHLVEIIRVVSPAVAVQLTGRQVEVERRIDELANIAIQIAADAK
jgi:tetratricopeptide (TPR) repeat protein